jgi:hypothetical protein
MRRRRPEDAMSDIEDRAAITALSAAYSAGANRLSGRDMGKVLAADVVLSGITKLAGQPDTDIKGVDAVVGFFSQAFTAMEFIHQIPTMLEIHISGDRATATTALVEYVKPKGAPLMMLLGHYEDTLVRTAAGWRFTKRHVHAKSFAPIGAP